MHLQRFLNVRSFLSGISYRRNIQTECEILVGAMNANRMVQALLLVLLIAPSSPDLSPALAGIAHVAFRVTDVQKSREFYRTLGFEQAFEIADPGKPPVSYIKINDRQFIELYGRGEDSQATGLTHVCYEAADGENTSNKA
jgi:hypothetical protein